jgi:hypothetical protein
VNRRRRSAVAWRAFLALLLVLFAPLAPAQPRAASEYAVKAAFVFRFGEYVQWPATAFADSGSPLRIGVFGADALALELERIGADRALAGRTVQVRRLVAGDRVDDLQLLFVGEMRGGADLLGATAGQPTLTITETAVGQPEGSVINLVVVDGKVRFDVALPAAQSRQLKISSRLLAVARSVAGQP